jgi:hypothetical protein
VEDVNRKTQKKRGKVLIFLIFLTVYLFQSIIWLLYFSSNSGESMPPFELNIDRNYVLEHLKGENKPLDIRKYIL